MEWYSSGRSSLGRGLATVLLVAAGAIAGTSGCRWRQAQPYGVTPAATTDPAAVFRAVQAVVAQSGYKVTQQDPANRTLRMYAHVDETASGNDTYITIQVDPNGIVRLVPSGVLVSGNEIHTLLNSELVSLQDKIAARLGGRAGGTPSSAVLAPAVSGMASTDSVATSDPSLQTPGAGTATSVASGRIVRGDPQRNAYALVIGIEKYRDVPAAPGARADAEDFARVTEQTLGLPPNQIHKIFDDRATKADMEGELEWIKLNVPKGGRVYFYYSGHGSPGAKPGGNAKVETPYLVPYDVKPTSLEQTAVPLSQVLDTLKRSAAKEVFAFLDSCFSGKEGFRSGPSVGTRPLVPVELSTPASTVVYSAAHGDQVAGPDLGGRRGLFSKYLLQALGGAKAEYNGDKNITFKELVDWMNNRVSAESRQANRVQDPSVSIQKGSETQIYDTIIAYGVASE
jgi:hypothetical protein